MRGGYRNDLSNWVAGFFLWHKSYSFVVSYIDVRVGTFVLKLSFGLVGGGVMMGLLGWGRTFFSFFFFLFPPTLLCGLVLGKSVVLQRRANHPLLFSPYSLQDHHPSLRGRKTTGKMETKKRKDKPTTRAEHTR